MINRLETLETPTTVVEQNLAFNFPKYEITVTLEDTETRFGLNFQRIMKDVLEMDDTFGLCGVLSVTANGLLANYRRWQDIDYDATILKGKFDKWCKTGTGESAWSWFDKRYRNRFQEGPNDFAVLSSRRWKELSSKVGTRRIEVFPSTRWKDALALQKKIVLYLIQMKD